MIDDWCMLPNCPRCAAPMIDWSVRTDPSVPTETLQILAGRSTGHPDLVGLETKNALKSTASDQGMDATCNF